MHHRRAILAGIFLWGSSFLVGLLIVILTGKTDPESTEFLIGGMISLVLIAAIASEHYFHGRKVERNAKDGFILGVYFVLTGTILDLTTLIPGIIKGTHWQEIWKYYSSEVFLVSTVIILVVPFLLGARKIRKA